MAPESLLYGRFTVETDVWSYGVLLWELYTYSLQPYYGCTNEQVLKLILQGVQLSPISSCPPPVQEVMRSCWSSNPCNRPSFATIKENLATIHRTYDLEGFEASLDGRDYREEVVDFSYDLSRDDTTVEPQRSPLHRMDSMDATSSTLNSTFKGYPESVDTQISQLPDYQLDGTGSDLDLDIYSSNFQGTPDSAGSQPSPLIPLENVSFAGDLQAPKDPQVAVADDFQAMGNQKMSVDLQNDQTVVLHSHISADVKMDQAEFYGYAVPKYCSELPGQLNNETHGSGRSVRPKTNVYNGNNYQNASIGSDEV
ncbi:tyrosine-protein kinase ABL2 [Hyalella azteca]|uniref:Tyrosine-protein kinase ABL2 n=1 Tax=Hyalella azteca TaxID=294128 RepID=A0A8B7P3G9_HYAAZ|nr:tyrosine-protein kinase ABL2 [Hyalella azteca]